MFLHAVDQGLARDTQKARGRRLIPFSLLQSFYDQLLLDVFQYEGSIAGLSVTAGDCYWIEITNDVSGGGAFWFWETAMSGPG